MKKAALSRGEIKNRSLELLKNIPSPDYLTTKTKVKVRKQNQPFDKHGEAYEEFCKWMSYPKEIRQPPTQMEFEAKWGLSKNYTSHWKERDDFRAKWLKGFWRWTINKYPDVVYAVYRRAVQKSTADAKLFSDIVGQELDVKKEKEGGNKLQPIFMVGIPQEAIDKFAGIPKGYGEVADKTIEAHKSKSIEGEVVE